MDRNQREYYLHEQLHVINDELGEGDDTHAEADEYRRRIQELHLAEDSEKKLLKEVDRLAKMQGSNQEAAIDPNRSWTPAWTCLWKYLYGG